MLSCSSMKNHDKDVNNFNYESKPTISDSLLITYTIQQAIERNYNDYIGNVYLFSDEEKKKISFSVDRVYYSPDSLKFIGFIITREPYFNKGGTVNINEFRNNGFAIIGIRQELHDLWIIYGYDWFCSLGWMNTDSVREDLYDHFFCKLSNTFHAGYNSRNQYREMLPMKYDLDDSRFWDGPFFDTSTFHGYTFFQIADSRAPDLVKNKDRRKVYPLQVEYPDLIRNMYNKN